MQPPDVTIAKRFLLDDPALATAWDETEWGDGNTQLLGGSDEYAKRTGEELAHGSGSSDGCGQQPPWLAGRNDASIASR